MELAEYTKRVVSSLGFTEAELENYDDRMRKRIESLWEAGGSVYGTAGYLRKVYRLPDRTTAAANKEK